MSTEESKDGKVCITSLAAAAEADQVFVSRESVAPELGEFDILAKVLTCGVCATDLMYLGAPGKVAGHETVGKVMAVGSSVKSLTVGQRIGMGFQHSACLSCHSCTHGYEQCCPKRKLLRHVDGGFASHVVWDSRFCFPIPEGLESRVASPLLCAGATVYSALVNNGLAPGSRVGIIGIGGLGHLALQFSAAMGYNTVALSRSADKEEFALKLGAHEFINTREPFDGVDKFDFVLSTVAADLDWASLLSQLRPGGKLCLVGVPRTPVSVSAALLVLNHVSLCGSLIGNRKDTQDMLTFAKLHNIKPIVEPVPFTVEGATTAVQKIKDNTARFRMVLVADE